MQAVVTGASGMVGANLVEALLAEGAEVVFHVAAMVSFDPSAEVRAAPLDLVPCAHIPR